MIIKEDDDGNEVRYMEATKEEVMDMYGYRPFWQQEAAADGWIPEMGPKGLVTYLKLIPLLRQ